MNINAIKLEPLNIIKIPLLYVTEYWSYGSPSKIRIDSPEKYKGEYTNYKLDSMHSQAWFENESIYFIIHYAKGEHIFWTIDKTSNETLYDCDDAVIYYYSSEWKELIVYHDFDYTIDNNIDYNVPSTIYLETPEEYKGYYKYNGNGYMSNYYYVNESNGKTIRMIRGTAESCPIYDDDNRNAIDFNNLKAYDVKELEVDDKPNYIPSINYTDNHYVQTSKMDSVVDVFHSSDPSPSSADSLTLKPDFEFSDEHIMSSLTVKMLLDKLEKRIAALEKS